MRHIRKCVTKTIFVIIFSSFVIRKLYVEDFLQTQLLTFNETQIEEHLLLVLNHWPYKNSKIQNKKNYILNNPNICSITKCDLIIVICSGFGNFNKRQAIRDTWGRIETTTYKVAKVFLVGKPNIDSLADMKKRLLNEHEDNRDLIEGDFIDSYLNLTLKSMFMLDWVTNYCNNAKYMLKVDDDMYVNIPNLFRALNEISALEYMMGYLIKGTGPIREKTSKWHTPENTYPYKYYPNYLSGTGYIISLAVVAEVCYLSEHLESFWLEDVFITGICAGKLNLKLIPRADMSVRSPNGCKAKSVITGHEIEWHFPYINERWMTLCKSHDSHLYTSGFSLFISFREGTSTSECTCTHLLITDEDTR